MSSQFLFISILFLLLGFVSGFTFGIIFSLSSIEKERDKINKGE